MSCLQAISTLLWRPLGSHSFRPTWNVLHQTWGKATMAVGSVALCLGIWVAGVGWPYYALYAVQVGGILGMASLQKPQQVSISPCSGPCHASSRGCALLQCVWATQSVLVCCSHTNCECDQWAHNCICAVIAPVFATSMVQRPALNFMRHRGCFDTLPHGLM